jgi:4-hydroxy-4-methyl-2-oxoglutarate aldolase
VVIPIERVAEVEELARAREARELELRAKLEAGALTYDLHGLRAVVDPDA